MSLGRPANASQSFSQYPGQIPKKKELTFQSGLKRKLKKDKVHKQEDVWHFDKPMSDEQFLQIVVQKMEPLGLEIAYDIFQDFFLPKHRKPSFSDWCRFRRLENLISM